MLATTRRRLPRAHNGDDEFIVAARGAVERREAAIADGLLLYFSESQ